MGVQVYSNTEIELPAKRQHCQAMEVQDSLAAADLPPIKEHIQVQESNATIDLLATDGCPQVGLHENLHEIITSGLLDFDSWTSLISDTEKMHADNIETISVVFDSFLSTFPLCAEYWKRYTDHKMRLCKTETVVEIFERAVESATHSVGLWVDYCSFSMCAFTDPFNTRRLFERALSFVGKDYLSHTLWDMYLRFEFSQQHWSSLAHIIIRTLKFPTKRLQNYYDNLKKFAAIMEEEMSCQESCRLEVQSEAIAESSFLASEEEIYHVINDLQDSTIFTQKSKALNKFISIGKQFYQRARMLDEKIHCFESYIERHVFHVQPLDENQLKNWHDYLDFIEKQEDFDWAVKLYERCLIVCANYPEFWMRYVEFMELKGGQELAKFSLDRATQIFLKNVPEMHLFNAWCKEQIGDVDSARASFLQCRTESNTHFVEKTIKEANMEKRLGNLTGAYDIYEKALKVAAERHTLDTVSILYIHLYRLKYQITGSADAARDVIINGIQHVPHCRSLLEELIKFAMMHDGSRQLNVVDSIIATEISSDAHVSQGLGAKDREELSCLYLEFVDLCGSCNQLRKAWNRHMKLFPHLIRIPSSHKHPTTSSNHLLSVLMEGRQRKPFSVANQPAIGHDADNLVQHSTKEQEVKVLEHRAIMSDQVTSDQSQQDGDNSVQENMQQISPQVVQSGENEVGLHKQTSSLLHQLGSGMSGSMELSHGLHQCGEVSAPVDSNIVMVHPFHEDASGASDLAPNFEQPGGAITHLDSSLITDQEQDHQIEIPIKVVSLENLSLNSQENESQDINFAALERVDPQGISLPADPFSGSPLHSEATVSAKREGNAHKIESGSPSSSENHQNPLPAHTNSQPEVPSTSEETWPHTNRVLISTGEAIAESRGHSQPQHQHQHQQASPREQFSTDQIGGKIEVLSSSTDTRNYYQGASHGLRSPVANVLQQSSGSASQPVYSHTQAQISQYPMQSSEQLGHLQQTQAYNQILEYHHQHQLLQQQYQQQMLQMQQPYILHQHQQPYYQPLLQQQYLQQQQKQQQQQQQQLQLSPDHSNQLQQPQYQLYQHQEQYQQYQQGYQVLLQQYQLQQEQGYQQLLQHHQLQQLQGYQQLQQYQQSQQQQQLQDGHQNHQQHIQLMQNQGWKVIHDQQGQRIAMPPGSTVSPQPSEGPHTQEQSPQVPTQPNASGATRPVGSSESQLSSTLAH